jgi:hypothetical protein
VTTLAHASRISAGRSDRYVGTAIRLPFWAKRRGSGLHICKIAIRRLGAEFVYGLSNFGSEGILEVVVIGRDAGADRCSPPDDSM